MFTISAHADIRLVILVVSILSLVDSSGSTLESVSELLNVDTSLSYAVFFWKSVLLDIKSLTHIYCHWDSQMLHFLLA